MDSLNKKNIQEILYRIFKEHAVFVDSNCQQITRDTNIGAEPMSTL
jgi:hypothetical protein